MQPKFSLQEEASGGEGSDGSGGGSGGDGGDDSTTKGPSNEQIMAHVSLLTDSVTRLSDGLATLTASQRTMLEGKQGDHQQDEPTPPEDVDLEAMDRKTFGAHLVNQFSRVLDEKLKTVNTSINGVSQLVNTTTANAEVAKAAGEFKDFWEWKPEMGKILQTNPTLTIKQAYQLARTENPDKVAEVDKKFTKAPEKKAPFGFFPGSSSSVKSTKMPPREAALDAWDKTMGELGGVGRLN